MHATALKIENKLKRVCPPQKKMTNLVHDAKLVKCSDLWPHRTDFDDSMYVLVGKLFNKDCLIDHISDLVVRYNFNRNAYETLKYFYKVF